MVAEVILAALGRPAGALLPWVARVPGFPVPGGAAGAAELLQPAPARLTVVATDTDRDNLEAARATLGQFFRHFGDTEEDAERLPMPFNTREALR